MNIHLYNMLKADIESRRSKAILTLNLMSENAVGIGDHSTDDFYNNAKSALSELATSNDELEALNKYVQEEGDHLD